MENLKDRFWSLAACDQASGDLLRESKRIPTKVAELEAKAEAARDVADASKARVDQADAHRRAKEVELQDTEAQREKFQGQAPMVKTNQEYTALLHEVEVATQKISAIEEEILVAMDESDRRLAEYKIVEKEQGEIEAGLRREIDEYGKRLVEVERDLKVQEERRITEVGLLPDAAKLHYTRIHKRHGTATAWVVNGNCGRCHNQIPPEWINQVIRGEMKACGSCQRILVIPEE